MVELTIKYLRQSIIVGTIFVVFNCIVHVVFYLQYANNNIQMPPTLSASVQKVFTGEKIRTYRDKGFEGLKGQKLYKDVSQRYKSSCQFWAVVTTIFPPSAAVRKVVKDPVWCTVIVADMKTPSKDDYMIALGASNNSKTVFLTTSQQDAMFPYLSKTIPWNHFARKNIGYMYAIKHSATHIWDFDDDNINVLPLRLSKALDYKIQCEHSAYHLINPYPYFNVNESYAWPRGFPLEEIRNRATLPNFCDSNRRRRIAVIQSLANIQPDVDAIYRFTRETPFSFGSTPKSHPLLLVPRFSYAPFNAQATLWMKEGFRYMALPTTVTGRVSDIWRSYIAQYFFHRLSVHLAFAPPYVEQNRNPHDYRLDFKEELDLYQKSNELVRFLASDKTHAFDIQQLYIDLYERGFIEKEDVDFIRAWMQTFNASFMTFKKYANM